MNINSKYWFVITGFVVSVAVHAQLPSSRVRPATMYYGNDIVRSPRLGLTTKIPEGWSGVLPRDTEVFLLMPENGSVGEIYVVLNEKVNLQQQRERWERGISLAEGLSLERDGEISRRGDEVIGTMAKLVGQSANTQISIYLEAKCSPHGFCLCFIGTADQLSFKNVKSTLQTLVDNTVFNHPSTESPYLNFDWKRFLSGKILLSFGYDKTSKRVDEVNLCPDGTFQSTITRTGVFKDEAKGYQGKKKGKWDVTSDGESATIIFTFNKLAPVKVNIEGRDEEVYVRGQRYFIGESEHCEP